jgi:hypothetical protein
MEKPDYFICTSDEVLKKIKPYASRDIVDLATIDSSDYKERWDKLEKKKIKV